jgi:hypothetical protein
MPGLQRRGISDGMAILLGSQFSEAQLHILLTFWTDILPGVRSQSAALFLRFRIQISEFNQAHNSKVSTRNV